MYLLCYSYSKFARGKDLSNRSDCEIDSIFGRRKLDTETKIETSPATPKEEEIIVSILSISKGNKKKYM